MTQTERIERLERLLRKLANAVVVVSFNESEERFDGRCEARGVRNELDALDSPAAEVDALAAASLAALNEAVTPKKMEFKTCGDHCGLDDDEEDKKFEGEAAITSPSGELPADPSPVSPMALGSAAGVEAASPSHIEGGAGEKMREAPDVDSSSCQASAPPSPIEGEPVASDAGTAREDAGSTKQVTATGSPSLVLSAEEVANCGWSTQEIIATVEELRRQRDNFEALHASASATNTAIKAHEREARRQLANCKNTVSTMRDLEDELEEREKDEAELRQQLKNARELVESLIGQNEELRARLIESERVKVAYTDRAHDAEVWLYEARQLLAAAGRVLHVSHSVRPKIDAFLSADKPSGLTREEALAKLAASPELPRGLLATAKPTSPSPSAEWNQVKQGLDEDRRAAGERELFPEPTQEQLDQAARKGATIAKEIRRRMRSARLSPEELHNLEPHLGDGPGRVGECPPGCGPTLRSHCVSSNGDGAICSMPEGHGGHLHCDGKRAWVERAVVAQPPQGEEARTDEQIVDELMHRVAAARPGVKHRLVSEERLAKLEALRDAAGRFLFYGEPEQRVELEKAVAATDEAEAK